MRLFAGVPISIENRERISRFTEKLRLSGCRAGWVRPDNLHFTLQFIGETPVAEQTQFRIALRAVQFRAFPVKIISAEIFPHEKPRILYLKIADPIPLARLAGDVSSVLRAAGFRSVDNRPFLAHLTLGRIRNSAEAATYEEKTLLGCHLEEKIDRFVLYESKLLPTGPEYNLLEQYECLS